MAFLCLPAPAQASTGTRGREAPELHALALRADARAEAARRAASFERVQAAAADTQAAAASHDLDLYAANLATRRQRLRARLAAIYRVQQGGLARLLLSDPSDTGRLLIDRDASARLIARDRDELQAVAAEADRTRQALVGLDRRRDQALARAAEDDRLAAQAQDAIERIHALRLAGASVSAGEIAAARAAVDALDGGTAGGLGAALSLAWPIDAPGAGGGDDSPPVLGRFGAWVDAASGARLTRRGVVLRAQAGTLVHAAAAGTVRFAGPLRGYGLAVLVDHGGGVMTLIGGLATLAVEPDANVTCDTTLGAVGATPVLAAAPAGAPTAVYLELRVGGVAVDPLPLLRQSTVNSR